MNAEEAIAAERRRIAERLHDGPVQLLTASLLFLDSALGTTPEDERHPALQRGVSSLREAILACRALMAELDDDEGP